MDTFPLSSFSNLPNNSWAQLTAVNTENIIELKKFECKRQNMHECAKRYFSTILVQCHAGAACQRVIIFGIRKAHRRILQDPTSKIPQGEMHKISFEILNDWMGEYLMRNIYLFKSKHLKGQLEPPVIEVAIRNSLKRKLQTPAFQLAESNLRRHSQLALFRLSWHDAFFAARQILWLVTPLLNFLLSNRLAPYKAEGGGFDQRKRREKS